MEEAAIGMDSPVTKREFDAHSKEDRENFQAIHIKLDKIANNHPTNGELGIMLTNIAKDVSEVKIQTTKTNGRVTTLEVVNSKNKGRGEGMKSMWGWVVAGVTLAMALGAFALQNLRFK